MLDSIRSISVLVIDDGPFLTGSIDSHYRTAGRGVRIRLVEDIEELTETLEEKWDVIVYGQAPAISVNEILGALHQDEKDIPVILFSAHADREVPPGIADIIDKAHPQHLFAAIERETDYLWLRRECRSLRVELADSALLSRRLAGLAGLPALTLNAGIIVENNSAFAMLFGTVAADFEGAFFLDFICREYVREFKERLKKAAKLTGEMVELFCQLQHADTVISAHLLMVAPSAEKGRPYIQIFLVPQSVAQAGQELAARPSAVGLKTGQQDPGPVGQTPLAVTEISPTVVSPAARRDESPAPAVTATVIEKKYCDAATEFPLRQGFASQLLRLKKTVQLSGRQATLIVLTCNDFEALSNIGGLDTIDTLYHTLAPLLKQAFPDAQFTRYSDPLITILDISASRLEIESRLKLLMSQLDETLFSSGQKSLQTTFSAAVIFLGEASPEEGYILVSRALKTIDELKTQSDRKSSYRICLPQQSDVGSSDAQIKQALLTALEQNQVTLFYEPVYDTSTGGINRFAVHALPVSEDVPGLTLETFKALLKQHDLHNRFEKWLLIAVSRLVKSLAGRSRGVPEFVVHLSGDSLQDAALPQLMEKVNQVLGSSTASLLLEFAEEDILTAPALTSSRLQQLVARGSRIAISTYTGSKTMDKIIATLAQVDQIRLPANFLQNLDDEEAASACLELLERLKEMKASIQVDQVNNAAAMTRAWTMGIRYLTGSYLGAAVEDYNLYLTEQPETA